MSVVAFFNDVYVPAAAVPNDWTGSVAGCSAGATSAAYADATMDMVNFFRAMVRLPAAVPRVAIKDAKGQQAALMMTAQNALSHSPTPTWACYTADGAEAAGRSNLALGIAGAPAIALYIHDPGAGNAAVGHRRWILYPRQTEMGTGSSNRSNALWVIGNFGARPGSPEFVAWPTAGFVPYALVYPRWSFAVNTDAVVSFANTTVSMTSDGADVPLTLLPNATGYGDNTLVWEPSGLSFVAGAPDQVVSVSIRNVDVGGDAKDYAYQVKVFDPLSPAVPTLPSLSGVRPTGGRVTGGTPVVLTGTGFVAGATVTIGGAAASNVRVVNETTIAALAPPATEGPATVVVTTAGGQATLSNAFTYLPLPTFTDDPLQPGTTLVRAVHVDELRQRIGELRARWGLAPYSWTNPALIAGQVHVRAQHFTEMRSALEAVLVAAGLQSPGYLRPSLEPGQTTIAAIDLAELRAALLGAW